MKTQKGASSRATGSLNRDIDKVLLSLVTSGCSIDDIVVLLHLPLDEVHRRLVKLRLAIEDLSASTSNG